jgi:hypothetical protein
MVRTRGNKRTGKRRQQQDTSGGEATAQVSGIADAGLTDEGPMLVVQLTEQAFRGNAQNTGELLSLSNKESGGSEGEAAPIGFSQALAWELEPEWQGESSEQKAETAIGSREPENQMI